MLPARLEAESHGSEADDIPGAIRYAVPHIDACSHGLCSEYSYKLGSTFLFFPLCSAVAPPPLA